MNVTNLHECEFVPIGVFDDVEECMVDVTAESETMDFVGDEENGGSWELEDK